MTDLERLATTPAENYRSVQFSSYDRRSVSPDKPYWFGNADGFGLEPVPGFEKVLREPGSDGIGEYLMCDVKGPGAIVRLWTAQISGTVKMFLDGKQVYNGAADRFFWNFPAEAGDMEGIRMQGTFRQYDALYFPVPFAKSCRIEWTGDLKAIHFYHVGMRLYDKNAKVKTYRADDPKTYRSDIEHVAKILADPESTVPTGEKYDVIRTVSKGDRQEIIRIEGNRVIEQLKIKLNAPMPEKALRQTVLRIFFDGASVPQVESPVGDFFGAAPGVNPYVSLPFSIAPDGTMTCRFAMPFKESASVQIINMSDQNIELTASASARSYTWDENRSMYFRARWRINHGLKASNREAVDIPYLLAMGEGRLAGAACFLMNPSNVPTASGNWWGEGDEKIFVDNDRFPSFFGTGSEDYYNYSWSAPDIFCYPYCGQPRDDGPATRGFVSNFRWHVLDDIPFADKLAFYMELLPHGIVPGFAYARIVYLYGREGTIDDHCTITADDLRPQTIPEWNPVTFRSSLNYRFVSAETAFKGNADTGFEYDPLWAEGKIFVWKPKQPGEKINFEVQTSAGKKDMQISAGHMPGGGKIRVYVNNIPVKLNKKDTLDLHDDHRMLNRAYTTGEIDFVQGKNVITIENLSDTEVKTGIDLLWIKD